MTTAKLNQVTNRLRVILRPRGAFEDVTHDHPPDATQLVALEFRTRMLERCRSEHTPFKEIYDTVLAEARYVFFVHLFSIFILNNIYSWSSEEHYRNLLYVSTFQKYNMFKISGFLPRSLRVYLLRRNFIEQCSGLGPKPFRYYRERLCITGKCCEQRRSITRLH